MKKRIRRERVYVRVNSDFDPTGYMQPRTIIWKDGRTFPIEQIRDVRPACFFKTGNGGDCYTVIVRGQEKLLFFERTDPQFVSKVGRWWVEIVV